MLQTLESYKLKEILEIETQKFYNSISMVKTNIMTNYKYFKRLTGRLAMTTKFRKIGTHLLE